MNMVERLAASNPANIVIVPHLRPLTNVELSDNLIGFIASSLTIVVTDMRLCPSRPLSMASACISVHYLLCACARLHGTLAPGAFFLIGPHASA